MSLDSFSQPAGILTAVNTGAIIAGGIYISKLISDRNNEICEIQSELKKLKNCINQMDNASVPKMTMIVDGLIENINNMGKRINAYVISSEDKNATRDRNMNTLYEYLKCNDPHGVPSLEKGPPVCIHTHPIKRIEPEPEPELQEEDSDVDTIARMMSSA